LEVTRETNRNHPVLVKIHTGKIKIDKLVGEKVHLSETHVCRIRQLPDCLIYARVVECKFCIVRDTKHVRHPKVSSSGNNRRPFGETVSAASYFVHEACPPRPATCYLPRTYSRLLVTHATTMLFPTKSPVYQWRYNSQVHRRRAGKKACPLYTSSWTSPPLPVPTPPSPSTRTDRRVELSDVTSTDPDKQILQPLADRSHPPAAAKHLGPTTPSRREAG